MSKRNNVNPDYYKIAGRDRPNETAAARLALAAAAKLASRERPARMPKAKPRPPQAASKKKKSERAAAD
ncbi:MAG TPA: hypothetical protein VGK86_07770 [Thermoanaerobaculia bacterium]|jgi:hypothetical protein